MKLNFAPSKASCPLESRKMASITMLFSRDLLFANPSFWSKYSDVALDIAVTR